MNTLRFKLRLRNQFDFWHLNLGIVSAGLNHNAARTSGEKLFYTYLDELAELVKTAPAELSPKRLVVLTEVARYSEEKQLSKEKREELAKKLIESRNLYLNGVF